MKVAALASLSLLAYTALAAPSTITLSNKVTLTDVRPIKWTENDVTVEHARGVDTIQFRYMSPESRKAWEAEKQPHLEATRQAFIDDAREVAFQQRVRLAIEAKKIILGMSEANVIASWGRPERINGGGSDPSSLSQWVYGENYLYFKNGRLHSWN